ncbi:LOW QUALITY PROTEIN: hypothetical protein MSG28_016185 [Choristoneura fumiferana]|uniref:Uncharacterized protein n=1 Tax=Choristoneura fumiferana TaxID=7141 RepID=A0ACC0K661_CHOFU|nr:LOW QUALITY PROTEIN: hypothetical protein MSG28_016185 [Choristoneura fumiferana]
MHASKAHRGTGNTVTHTRAAPHAARLRALRRSFVGAHGLRMHASKAHRGEHNTHARGTARRTSARAAGGASSARTASGCTPARRIGGTGKQTHTARAPHAARLRALRAALSSARTPQDARQQGASGEQRTHTGEKPYQCASCPKRFADSNQLRIHTRRHTGERPYCCRHCRRTFTQKPALNRHYRVSKPLNRHSGSGSNLNPLPGSSTEEVPDDQEIDVSGCTGSDVYQWCGEWRVRASALTAEAAHGAVCVRRASNDQALAQITPVEERQTDEPTRIQALKERIRDLEKKQNSASEAKCLICLGCYTSPTVSIQCWHVYCEVCWLESLRAKKICPQCNAITTAQHLRRIYM